MNILLIGEIQPKKSNSASVILHRHFSNHRIHLSLLSERELSQLRPLWFKIAICFVNRLSKILSQYLVQSIEPAIVLRKWSRLFSSTLPCDLILCVAHGRVALHAWRLGLIMKKPVVTFFHDWWPEMIMSYRGHKDLVVRTVRRDFDNLQRYSDLSLAVCPGMSRNLTYAKKVKVLYPIPDDSIKLRVDHKVQHPLRVVYTGSLWNPYGEMLLKLADELHGRTDVALKIHGDPKYISPQKREELLGSGILEDYIDDEPYKKRITDEADVLLAVMGRDSDGESRMATSFPSKVANYFQTGNIVLLWALPGSSLNEFALEYDYPWLVEADNPEEVANLLTQMAADPVLVSKARLDALRIRQQVFDAAKIQQQFESALKGAIAGYNLR